MPADETPESMKPGSGYGGVWRRMRRNAGMVLGGRAVFGLLNLAAATLAVRAAGIEAFGVVVLLHAYVRLVAGLLKFQTWATVTRFGADCIANDRLDDFQRLVGFTLRLDLFCTLFAVLTAIAAIPLAADWLDWPEEARRLAPWFALTIPFITSATPTGIARLFDRFGALVVQHAVNAIVRFCGVLIVWVMGAGMEGLIIVWGAASVISGVWLFGAVTGEMRKRSLRPQILGSWSSLAMGFPRLWRFVIAMNASSLIDTALTQAVVLIVGGALDASAAGLFGVVRQVTESFSAFPPCWGRLSFRNSPGLKRGGPRRDRPAALADHGHGGAGAWRVLRCSHLRRRAASCDDVR